MIVEKYGKTFFHVKKEQPAFTVGKMVLYKPVDSHWHMPRPADYLNWEDATIGKIDQYKVLGDIKR